MVGVLLVWHVRNATPPFSIFHDNLLLKRVGGENFALREEGKTLAYLTIYAKVVEVATCLSQCLLARLLARAPACSLEKKVCVRSRW